MDQASLWNNEYIKNPILWAKETQSLPKILSGKSVLELGVGNGKTLAAILLQKPKSIVALDFSEKAIEICQSRFPKSVSFQVASITEMPFQDETFDVVVCHYILNALSEKDFQKAVSEIKRVLKKKGKVIFEDFAVGDFRQKGKSKTLKKKSGITCHYFTIPELNKIFSEFTGKFKVQETTPILHQEVLKRKIISGILTKK